MKTKEEQVKSFIRKVMFELDHAETKHPHFADVIFLNYDVDVSERILSGCRSCLAQQIADGTVATSGVMTCEYAEFALEVCKGDWNAALIELAQCVAVLIRTAGMVQAEIDKDKNQGV